MLRTYLLYANLLRYVLAIDLNKRCQCLKDTPTFRHHLTSSVMLIVVYEDYYFLLRMPNISLFWRNQLHGKLSFITFQVLCKTQRLSQVLNMSWVSSIIEGPWLDAPPVFTKWKVANDHWAVDLDCLLVFEGPMTDPRHLTSWDALVGQQPTANNQRPTDGEGKQRTTESANWHDKSLLAQWLVAVSFFSFVISITQTLLCFLNIYFISQYVL